METSNHKQFLFTVEFLVEADSSAAAVEDVVRLLNAKEVKEYKLKNMVRLTQESDHIVLQALKKKLQAQSQASNAMQSGQTLEIMRSFMQKNTLVRFTVHKEQGQKLSMPCRILNVDAETERLSVYHVDEKRVYSISLTEIEDYSVNA